MLQLFVITIILMPFRILISWAWSKILGLDDQSYKTAIIVTSIIYIIIFLANIFNLKGFYASMLSEFFKTWHFFVIFSFLMIKLIYRLKWKESIWIFIPWYISQFLLGWISQATLVKFISSMF